MQLHTTGPGDVVIEGSCAAARQQLLDDICELYRTTPLEQSLSGSIWLIVSSSELRRQLAAALTSRLGGAVLGLSIHTLRSAAQAILAASEYSLRDRSALLEIYANRLANELPLLSQLVSRFKRSEGQVARSVGDLLDAGLNANLLEPLEDCLHSLSDSEAKQRANELIRLAAHLSEAAPDSDWTSSGLLERAAHALQTSPHPTPIARAVFVYGVGDANGHGSALVETLMTHAEARVYLDHPGDPCTAELPEPGIEFARTFLDRIHARARRVHNSPPHPLSARLSSFDASGVEMEAREVGLRIQSLIKQGVCPENIGIICRSLSPYATPLRKQLSSLSVPFSLPIAPHCASARRARACIRVFEQGRRASISDWFEARGETTAAPWSPSSDPSQTVGDVLTACTLLGVSTVGQLAALSLEGEDNGALRLPIPRRLKRHDSPDPGGSQVRLQRRRVQHETLLLARQQAHQLLEQLDAHPQRGTLEAHLSGITKWCLNSLHWAPAADETAVWFNAVESLANLAPPAEEFSFSEVLTLLPRATRGVSEAAHTTGGAGVRLLDAALARGLVFEHVFLMGLNHGVFPRTVREDPLLPETIRQALRAVLADLPLKRMGHDEERFLFAHLLSASQNVTLSWLRSDADGKELGKSVLVERLLHSRPDVTHRTVPRSRAALLTERPVAPDTAVAPFDAMLLHALRGERELLAKTLNQPLTWYLSRMAPQTTSLDPAKVIQARLKVLAELSPDRTTPEGRKAWALPSPYHGFVGGLRAHVDPRIGPLYITTLEKLATCGLQTYLSKLLGVESPPARHAGVQPLSNLTIGSCVHRALQLLVDDPTQQLQPTRQGLAHSPGRPVIRPSSATIEDAITTATAEAARDDIIRHHALIDLLREIVRPMVHHLIALDWPTESSTVHVIGAEIHGQALVEVNGVEEVIGFVADRCDRNGDQIRFTDYKTGKPISTAARASTRDGHLRKENMRGRRLQVLAYAASHDDKTTGRYLFADPELAPEHSEMGVSADETGSDSLFSQVSATLIRAYHQGAFLPHFLDPKGKKPSHCDHCEVSECCIRWDTTQRLRVTGWLEEARTHSTSSARALSEKLFSGRLTTPPEEGT